MTSNYIAATCVTGIIAWATVPHINQATEVAKKSKALTPFPIQVLDE